MGKLKDVLKVDKPTIGMVHLRPLLDLPRYDPVSMGMDKIISIALEEAAILERAGVDGVQVEDMWDIPYLRNKNIGYETAAALAVGIHAVRDKVSAPVGAGCCTNGADCAVACTVAAGTNWIRVFEWCNAFISQSGSINAVGANVSHMRSRLKADQVPALCDVNAKHGGHYIIHDWSVAKQATDIEPQDGDTAIVTGFDTGIPSSVENISKCKRPTSFPILIGSGLNSSNVNELLTVVGGAIIRSQFKEGGDWKNPVSYDRIKEFTDRVIALRQG